MKNLLTQWETKEENLRTNLIENLLTQWETEEENQKTGGNVPLIDKKHNGSLLLLDGKHSGNMLLIDRVPNRNVLFIDREHQQIGRWCWMCISSKTYRIGKTSKAQRIGEETFQPN